MKKNNLNINNLHIVFNDFIYCTRIKKQIDTLTSRDFFEEVFVSAFYSGRYLTDKKDDKNYKVTRFTLLFCHTNFFLFKPLKYLEFYFKVIKYYRNKNIGVVNTHSVLVLPLGVLFKILYGTKLVYDTHELETKQGFSLGFNTIVKLIEKLCIKYVDSVFVVSESISDWYRDTYAIDRPVVVLNSCRTKDVNKGNYFRDFFKIPPNKSIYLYQGVLNKNRGLELMVEAFKKKERNNDYLILMGFGSLENKIATSIAGIHNIFLHKSVSSDKLLSYTGSADVGIFIINKDKNDGNYVMPNKFFEYMMSGIPIISSPTNEMKSYIQENSLGIVLEENTVDCLNSAIDIITKMDKNIFKKNTRSFAFKYSWEQQEIKMVKEYERMLSLN